MGFVQGYLARIKARKQLADSRATLRGARQIPNPSFPHPISKLKPTDLSLKILFVRRLGGVGDVLTTTSAVRNFRKQRTPNAIFTYAVSPGYYFGNLPAALQGHPDIQDVILDGSWGAEDYDWVVDFSNIEPNLETGNRNPPGRIDIYHQYLGIEPIDPVPLWIVTPGEDEWARTWLGVNTTPGVKKIFVNLASQGRNRSLPLPKLQELVNLIGKSGNVQMITSHHQKVEVYHPGLIQFIDPPSKESLRRLGALIKNSDLIVTMDTATLHIAGALKIPIVGLFGRTNPQVLLKYYKPSVGMVANCPRKFCYWAPCKEIPENRCMVEFPIERVVPEIRRFLNV